MLDKTRQPPAPAGLLWVRILIAGWETFKPHSRTNTDLRDHWRHLSLSAKAPRGASDGVFGSASVDPRASALPTDYVCACGSQDKGIVREKFGDS